MHLLFEDELCTNLSVQHDISISILSMYTVHNINTYVYSHYFGVHSTSRWLLIRSESAPILIYTIPLESGPPFSVQFGPICGLSDPLYSFAPEPLPGSASATHRTINSSTNLSPRLIYPFSI